MPAIIALMSTGSKYGKMQRAQTKWRIGEPRVQWFICNEETHSMVDLATTCALPLFRQCSDCRER